jgi:hypothetical protein
LPGVGYVVKTFLFSTGKIRNIVSVESHKTDIRNLMKEKQFKPGTVIDGPFSADRFAGALFFSVI